MDKIISDLEEESRIGNAKAYVNLKYIFNKLHGENILLKDIDESFVNEFIHKMTKQGLSLNSRAVHLRELRAVINKAIKEGLIDETTYPMLCIGVVKNNKSNLYGPNFNSNEAIEFESILKDSSNSLLKIYGNPFLLGSFAFARQSLVSSAYENTKKEFLNSI